MWKVSHLPLDYRDILMFTSDYIQRKELDQQQIMVSEFTNKKLALFCCHLV